MSAHTPGPWKCWSIPYTGSPIIIYTGDIAPTIDSMGIPIVHPGTFICEVIAENGHMDDADNWIAHDNASLIAAAPDTAAERDRLKKINAELLEALEGLLNALPSATAHPAIKSARAAITKAKGGAA